MAKHFSPVLFSRDQTVRLRVTQGERKLLKLKAGDCGMTLSEYMLRSALGKPVRSKIAATIINELVQLNAELREQRTRMDAMPEEYGAILAGIAEAIERIPADAHQMEDF